EFQREPHPAEGTDPGFLPPAEKSGPNCDMVRTAGEIALLSWSARASNDLTTCHGADSFVVPEVLIVAQTSPFDITRTAAAGNSNCT
ncbi:MAG: hypothetical protein LOX97_01190, partial [Sphingomonas sp.]|nr:hypothetical protein [Sphingomonas sp.]